MVLGDILMESLVCLLVLGTSLQMMQADNAGNIAMV